MDEVLQNAIDTVDGARQHKCELEGRLGQLMACISQVSLTSVRSTQDIKLHFANLRAKIMKEIELKEKSLLDEVKAIENDALKPLKECKQVLEEGIQETVTVIENGEKLLHLEEGISSEGNIKKLNKFTNLAVGLSLDSVPEVPSVTEVACLSFHFKEKDFGDDICSAIKVHGHISKQAPVQITELEPMPGGMVVSWDETDSDESAEWIENGNTVLYKLQYCQGKISLTSHSASATHARPRENFHDAYTGKKVHYTVKKLSPNTAYTFRVSRCLFEGDDDSKIPDNWSPWSVYQNGITTLPGYEWAAGNGSEGYSIQDKCRVALKRNNSSQILYSKTGGYIVGYPITFKLEAEGKGLSLGDGFALIAKMDSTGHSLIREGSVCVAADGRIFINGMESKTRFSNFCRNASVRFLTQEIHIEEDVDLTKKSKGKALYVTLRVIITMMDKEAVFNWRLATASLATNSSNKLCLSFAASFKSQGWKCSVI